MHFSEWDFKVNGISALNAYILGKFSNLRVIFPFEILFDNSKTIFASLLFQANTNAGLINGEIVPS